MHVESLAIYQKTALKAAVTSATTATRKATSPRTAPMARLNPATTVGRKAISSATAQMPTDHQREEEEEVEEEDLALATPVAKVAILPVIALRTVTSVSDVARAATLPGIVPSHQTMKMTSASPVEKLAIMLVIAAISLRVLVTLANSQAISPGTALMRLMKTSLMTKEEQARTSSKVKEVTSRSLDAHS